MTTSESYLHAHAHSTDTGLGYRHASSQYFDTCKGLIHLYVTMTILTAHAQKHFSPETKSKVRPKKKFARPGMAGTVPECWALSRWRPGSVAESGHLRFCLSRLPKVTFRLFPYTVTGLFAFLAMLKIAKCFDG